MAIGATRTPIGFNKASREISLDVYWTAQSNFYELWKITGEGTMTGLKRGNSLTITGTGLNAIYAVPDTDAYKTRDTDYVFHKSDGSVSTACDGNRLIGYDFPRVIVKYLDASPYTIEYIGILDTGQSVNNKMRDDFHLSRWWDNTLSLHGVIKGNRVPAGQSVWTPESVGPVYVIHDTFTDTNNVRLNAHTMDVGSGWTEENGVWKIVSNKVSITDNTTGHAHVYNNTGKADVDISVDITMPSGPTECYATGILFRYQDATHKWHCLIESDGLVIISPAYIKLIGTGGGNTTTYNIVHAGGVTKTLRVVAKGNIITVYWDGTQVIQVTNSYNNDKTKHGLNSYVESTTYQFCPCDNFILIDS